MKEIWIIGFLVFSLLFNLVCLAVILACKKAYQNKLFQITDDMMRILDNDTDEKVMFFTGDKAIAALNTQINRMLDERQNIKAEYRASQLSAKRMLSNISHDIRTPMTVIQGYVEMLLMNENNDTEMLKKVDIKVKQVTKMMKDFFTLTKLESDDAAITLERVHCNEVCKSSILGFYDILSAQDFTIDAEIPEQDIFAWADQTAVLRVLYNLISNAIRYGAAGNYLQIKLSGDENYIYIAVADKGKGIDSTASHHVFDRLYAADDSKNKRIEGSGLGLTIAKQLSLKMGGDLTLKSEPFIKTVFILKLKKYRNL
ncbi:MAG: sensor histidine kinase [Lachnospiraceae bacterium]